MKRMLVLFAFSVSFVGCHHSEGPIEPQIESASVGDFTFNLSVTTKTASVKDTVHVNVQVYNRAPAAETLYVDWSYLKWWLITVQGDTIRYGAGRAPLGEYLVVGSHQSRRIDDYSFDFLLPASAQPDWYNFEESLFYLPPPHISITLNQLLNLK